MGIDGRGETAAARGEQSRRTLAEQYRLAKERGWATLPTLPGSDAPPVCTVAPAVTGTARVTFTLTSSVGTWTGTPAPGTASYQWYRNGLGISDAVASTYVCVAADIGAQISCIVRRENIYGVVYRESNKTVAVIP
jgi:hypothetical protein